MWLTNKRLHIVMAEALPRQLFELGAWTAIVGIRMDGDAAAWCEDARHLDVAWIHELDEVLHNDVDAVLVEVAVVAEGEEVEFQRLRLHHPDIGDVRDDDVGKVRLAGDRAEAGELWAVELHPIVILRMLVNEGLKYFRRIVLLIYGLFVTQEGECLFVGSFHNRN